MSLAKPTLTKDERLYYEGGKYPTSSSPYYAYDIRRTVEWETVPVYHATMRFKYALPDMSLIDNQIKAILDALGARWNPAIVWNAIPLSFLVDWIVGVGEFLEGLSVDNLEIPVVIEDFCHSVKYSTHATVDNIDYGVRLGVSRYIHTYYERRQAIPAMVQTTLRSRGVTKRKVIIGSSLIVSHLTSR